MTLSKEAKQALKYVQSYLANDANKGYGLHWDYDVEEAREEGDKGGNVVFIFLYKETLNKL